MAAFSFPPGLPHFYTVSVHLVKLFELPSLRVISVIWRIPALAILKGLCTCHPFIKNPVPFSTPQVPCPLWATPPSTSKASFHFLVALLLPVGYSAALRSSPIRPPSSHALLRDKSRAFFTLSNPPLFPPQFPQRS